MRQRIGIAITIAWIGTLLVAAGATPAAAGIYTRLQVILPGESAAPGTPSGKSGTPLAQTAGVPFSITVRACDDQWNLVAGVISSPLFTLI